MSRARVSETLVAGAATAIVAWPLTTLFTPASWLRPTLAMIAVVVVSGLLMRLLTHSWVAVAGAQVVAVVLAAGGLYGRGHLWHGLPTWDMVLAMNLLLVEARETIQSYAAPAPTTRGVTLGIGLAVAVTAIVVDHLAVMRRSPALAGLPLLTAFLISASNSGAALSPVYFVAAAAVWLLMVGRQGVASLRRWSTTVPMSVAGKRHSDDGDGTYGFAAVGRTLALVGLAAAVAIPAVVPHLPTRYLIDGLGRSAEAAGFSDGQIGLRTTVDLANSLGSRSQSPVLRYTTTATTTTPLRVEVLTDYEDRQWRPDRQRVSFLEDPPVSLPNNLDDSVARNTFRIHVDNARLEAPQIAAPTPIVAGDLDGVEWGLDRVTQVARVNRAAESYSFTYVEVEPTPALLAEAPASGTQALAFGDELALDPESESEVRALAAEIVEPGSSRIEAAMAIQKYFRSAGGFRYSLELVGPVTNDLGQTVQYDPITHFLRTKVGYCVQYATAMVMLARASGIPARMAIGFLPGTFDKGEYTVRASDAHAWPELYFDNVGWLRFEPTPSGSQNTVAPSWSLPQTESGGSGSIPGDTPAGVPTGGPNRPDGANDPGASDPTASTNEDSMLPSWLSPRRLTFLGWIIGGLVIGVLGALAVPLAARTRLRRQRRQAEDERRRMEVEWQAMVERIGDLGVIPPRGSTPRQAGQYYRREAYLEGDESQALRRVVDTLERSRYARPGGVLIDIHRDTHTVVKAVAAVRRRKDRLRATWWPSEGLAEWRDLRAAAGRRLRRPWEWLREALRRE
jgi:transglutaminase-like putative cysteine protease